MAKKGSLSKLLNFIAWLTGVIVALSVGLAMISSDLTLPLWLGGDIVAQVAGWIVVITTIVSAVMAIIEGLK